MNRFRAFFNSIVFVIISKLIQILAVFIAGIYFTVRFPMVRDNKQDLNSFFESNSLLITLIAWVVTFSVFLIIYLVSKKNMAYETKLDKGLSIKMVIICIICGIGINISIDGILTLINIYDLVPKYEQLMTSISNNEFYATIICVGILSPIFEELLYRGIILNKLRTGFSVFGAVMIQAIFFGIGHMNLVQGTYAFLIGIIFGYVVIWTGSLYSSIILHITINVLSAVITNVQIQNMDFNYLITIIVTGVLLTIIGLRIIYAMRQNEENKVTEFMD
ncbi:hypothetical protein SH1V18_30970 [Vallitalea longa]|uniref:CAAX prenyl protease 2/Lysostaphin resistance protein A-like domain-containing protein n=1 Tax=Vallitalea longa TaxID=2936439 RepID=A0A9W6DGJ9_9FIRM|nr:CPBP family intramembrane glutamic endopeptidase [Vallitalea longa]GKX30617.1 hypothetical protein SH1V18_30970 [Vallitalea longa]